MTKKKVSLMKVRYNLILYNGIEMEINGCQLKLGVSISSNELRPYKVRMREVE